jgi:hypothetical protein
VAEFENLNLAIFSKKNRNILPHIHHNIKGHKKVTNLIFLKTKWMQKGANSVVQGILVTLNVALRKLHKFILVTLYSGPHKFPNTVSRVYSSALYSM